MRPEPTDREKVIAMTDPEELEGARGMFKQQGRLTAELENLIAVRIARFRREKP